MVSKKRHVLLVFSNNPKKSFGVLFPLGLAYIGTALENKGHSVEIFDMNLYEDQYKALTKRLEKKDYDCIGISVRDIDFNPRHILPYIPIKLTWKNTPLLAFMKTAELIKNIAPEKLLIGGGAGFSIFADKATKASAVDVGIAGEGEELMVELMEHLDEPNGYKGVKGLYYKENGKLMFSGHRAQITEKTLNTVPKREFEGLPKNLNVYGSGIQTMRGCPFKCTYCTYSLIQGAKIRLKKLDVVIKDIENLRYNYGVKDFTFVDCIFAYPRAHAEGLIDEMIRKKIDVKWKAEVRVDAFDEKFLGKMIKSGCYRLDFSPESGSSKILNNLNKEVTPQQIVNSFRMLKKHPSIQTWYYMMFNTPGETWGTALETIKLVYKLYKMGLTKQHGRVLFSIARIYPHTLLEKIALKEGEITPQTDLMKPVFYNSFPLSMLNFLAIFAYNPLAFPEFASFYLKKQKFKLTYYGSDELSHSYSKK